MRAWRDAVFLFVACVMACLVAGCTTRRQGVDMSGFRGALSGSSATLFPPDLKHDPTAVATPPGTIVLARLSATAYELLDEPRADIPRARARNVDTSSRGNPMHPWVVKEGMTLPQTWMTASRVQGAKVVPFSEIVAVPVQTIPEDIMNAARVKGADWVCVYSAQTEYERQGLDLLQLITLGLMPTTSDARSDFEAMLIDLRTNTAIDEWTSSETGWQPAIGWTHGDASRQSADRAETGAMRAMLDRVSDHVHAAEKGVSYRAYKAQRQRELE